MKKFVGRKSRDTVPSNDSRKAYSQKRHYFSPYICMLVFQVANIKIFDIENTFCTCCIKRKN
jgi:hypothetical protein